MNNQFFTTKKETLDPSKANEQTKPVSFDIEVLNKYRDNQDFEIKLDNGVGRLSSKNDGWELQIDVQTNTQHVTTWLYKLSTLPANELQHFADHNIYARELSETAYKRWVEGTP